MTESVSERRVGYRRLTKREQEIVKLLSDGYSNEEVAQMLHVSKRTIEAHRSRIMLKLNLHTVPALVKYAIRHGLANAYTHRNAGL